MFTKKLFIRLIGVILIAVLIASKSNAQGQGSAVASGNWNTAATWSVNGTTRMPNCGDSIVIPANRTVTVTAQQDYTGCSQPMKVVIYGVLQFQNGYKLQLPCGSVVYVMTGGIMRKATAGGGNSTYLEICQNIEWSAADGPVAGYEVFPQQTLPITLLSFSAEPKSNVVEVNWSTATEVNNSYFLIERSADGRSFSSIAQIAGAGNSTQTLNYFTIDYNPLEGLSYYRLKQVDYDGTFSYSSIVPVYFGKTNEFEFVAASGTTQQTTIFYRSESDMKVKVRVTNIAGQEIYNNEFNAFEGLNKTEFDCGAHSEGVYIITLFSNDKFYSKRVVIK